MSLSFLANLVVGNDLWSEPLGSINVGEEGRMSKRKTALILWNPVELKNWEALWGRADLFSRVQALGLDTIWLGNEPPRSHNNWFSAPSIPDLIKDNRFRSVGKFVVMEVAQVFLDLAVASSAINKAQNSDADLYTQWEHVRLPIGVGVRVFSRKAFSKTGSETPDSVLQVINRESGKYRVEYDPVIYASFSESLFDFRWSVNLDRWFAGQLKDWSWRSAAQIAIKGDAHQLRYKSVGSFGRIDQRGLPAQYGFEQEECTDFPTYVMFDLTNKCNAACVMCPQSTGFAGVSDLKMLKKETFFRVIDQCVGRKIDLIRVTADGEPMIHPEFWTLLEYAKGKNVGPIGLTTNGSTLNERNISRLIESGITFIDVSLDAFTQETFEKVRVGLNYQKIIRNVDNLIEINRRCNAPLKIMVSYVIQQSNQHEAEAFADYWSPKVDKVLMRELTENVGLTKGGNMEDGAQVHERWPCPHFWRRIVVNYDSALKACPIDWNNRLVCDSLENVAIRDQWHGDFYHNYRMQHLNNNHSSDSLCRECKDWSTTPWKLGYEKIVGELQSLPQ